MGKEIGIDLGTATTEVSYINKNGHSRSIKIDGGNDVMPTVLFFTTEDEYKIGKAAHKMAGVYPKACVRNFKLDLTNRGAAYEVEAENGDRFSVKPIRAAQLFLNRLIQSIQPTLIKEFGDVDGTIDKAVITVPAQFDPAEKTAVKDAIAKAAGRAGFSDIKIAAEPTAAAIAYQDENGEDGETILVYDLGGGTFDVSVITKSGGRYAEVATGGDKRLGGNLITEKLAHFIWARCLDAVDKDEDDMPFIASDIDAARYSSEDYLLSDDRFKANRATVFEEAESAKIALSDDDETPVFINFFFDDASDAKMIEMTITIDEMNDLIKDEIKRTVDMTKRVFDDALSKGGIDKIDRIVLAGGSSQLRLVREMLTADRDMADLVGDTADTSTLISRGAAMLASIELAVEEKTRFEIGTRVVRGNRSNIFEPIIGVGESLPCSGRHRFYLTRTGQPEVTIEYYEKDAKTYPNASSIDDDGIELVDKLTISGIPPLPDLSVMVTFMIETDGTPTITAEILDADGKIIKDGELSISTGGDLY